MSQVSKCQIYVYRSERNGGRLTIVDGHLRQELDPDIEWDVAITDLTDAEADKILLTRDPIAAMAETDAGKLDELIREVGEMPEHVAAMLEQLNESATQEAIAAIADTPDADASTDAAAPAEEFSTFTVMLTLAQELAVREAIKTAKAEFGCETTADALVGIANEWMNTEPADGSVQAKTS